MNLLITTLGTSWQIVPELLSVTNPAQFDFFCGSKESCELRQKYNLKSVDECWIITTNGQREIQKLQNWANNWKIRLKVFVCEGVDSFGNQDEILKMRSLIYRVVLKGTEIADTLYLSLSGGRKTMSADMQEAGNLFGCDAMIHVVDKDFYDNIEIRNAIKNDDLLQKPPKSYSKYFVPLLVNTKISSSLVVSADKERLYSKNYPIEIPETDEYFFSKTFVEDRTLEKEIQKRKEKSSQLYANFYGMISSGVDKNRTIFRKLYFLHPDILRKLKEYKLGINPSQDLRIIKRLPKAELHSHIGGVLSPSEIIQVAENVNLNLIDKQSEFYKTISKIIEYKDCPKEFEKLVYGNLLNEENFYAIGIDKYQKLGNFQGSSILQTKEAIQKTLEIYAVNLIEQNIRYVEIRCSPYKYTKLGLSIIDVLNCMIQTLDKFKEKLEYRFIYIIGRESTKEQIRNSITELNNLLEKKQLLQKKIVGIDLAGNEGKTKPSELRDDFMPLLEKCLHITIHAGETENVESIWEAVYHLSADRIGHGLKLLEKPELMHRFIDKNIGIEMCPSSNDQIVGFSKKIDLYPLRKYLDLGLKVTLNTDDQGISRTNLTNEFIKASKLCSDLTLWDVIVLIRNSLSIAFCDRETKSYLMHSFEDEILQILSEEIK